MARAPEEKKLEDIWNLGTVTPPGKEELLADQPSFVSTSRIRDSFSVVEEDNGRPKKSEGKIIAVHWFRNSTKRVSYEDMKVEFL